MSDHTLTQTKTAAPTFAPVNSGVLQRKCACGTHTMGGGQCAECGKKSEISLQRSAVSNQPMNGVPAIVHDVLRSPGEPLDAGTRAFMEPRFGYDFSGVRVHSDAKAVESARVVSALAYTVGANIVFGTRQYEPGVMAGQRLIAHELTHVVQQSGGEGKAVASRDDTKLHAFPQAATPTRSSLVIGQPGDHFEQEADKVADVVMSPESGSIGHVDFVESRNASHVLRRQLAATGPTKQELREMQLRQFATRPSLALRQWRTLSQDDRDQIQWNMMSTYGQPFVIEFLKYTKGLKQPRLGPAGVLKGSEYTPKWLFDRGYRHAYGELWVHPSGEELTVLKPSPKSSAEPPPGPETDLDDDVTIEKKCPTSECFEDTKDEEECRECCKTTFPEDGSDCQRYCNSKCVHKL